MHRTFFALAALLLWCSSAFALNTTIIRQIANAPGWQRSTSYTGAANLTSSRVLAGPGYAASGSIFNNGSAVFLWIALGPGSGTSSPTGNGPQSCPTPGTSTATDGGVTWKCLVQIDYNSITGYLFDDVAWEISTAYPFNSFVVNDNPPKVYRLVANSNVTCTSASSGTGPTGTGSSISDGTCSWEYVTALGYSSQVGHVPKLIWTGSGTVSTIQMQDYYVGNVWYGGIARPEYIPGANGETNPIVLLAHSDFSIDDSGTEHRQICFDGSAWPDCGGTGNQKSYTITIQAASADSFMATAVNALAYNDMNGVAIHATAAESSTGFSGQWHGGSAFQTFDADEHFYGLQAKADHGIAIDGNPYGDFTIQNDIVDSFGRSTLSVGTWMDASASVLDSVIIYRGSVSGGVGVASKYPALIVNSTIVNLGTAANTICVGENFAGTLGALEVAILYNDYCAGFTYGFAEGNGAYSTLGAAITSTSQTAITTATDCCNDSFGDSAGYLIVDTEVMKITAGYDTTSLTVSGACPTTRACFGTTAATHLNGAPIVSTISRATSANNATDASAMTAPVGAISSNGNTFGVSDLPGVGSTCGSGNMSSCFGEAAASQFCNDAIDFRLLSVAGIIGSGVTVSVTQANWNTALTNATDIIGQVRPNALNYDDGAWEFYSANTCGGAPMVGGGRLLLR